VIHVFVIDAHVIFTSKSWNRISPMTRMNFSAVRYFWSTIYILSLNVSLRSGKVISTFIITYWCWRIFSSKILLCLCEDITTIHTCISLLLTQLGKCWLIIDITGSLIPSWLDHSFVSHTLVFQTHKICRHFPLILSRVHVYP
jgi:hypothetical protein